MKTTLPMLLGFTRAVLTVLATLGTLASAKGCLVSTVIDTPECELTPAIGDKVSCALSVGLDP